MQHVTIAAMTTIKMITPTTTAMIKLVGIDPDPAGALLLEQIIVRRKEK